MKAEEICCDMVNALNTLAAGHEVFKDSLVIAIHGQTTALLLTCSSVDDPDERKNALELFYFFTLQGQAFAYLVAACESIARMEMPLEFDVKNASEFESDHKVLRTNPGLSEFQMGLAMESLADLKERIAKSAGKLETQMLNILKPVVFDEVIDETVSK